jgi:hypothetical protein
MSKPLVVVIDIEEDGTCELCNKPVAFTQLCRFDDGTEVSICSSDYKKMLKLRKRAKDRREQADNIELNPVGIAGNGDETG